jgi:hypothetical protein
MDDPVLILIERGCRLGELLPSEEEILHSQDARDRARLIIAEMDKVDAEIKALGKAECDRRRASEPASHGARATRAGACDELRDLDADRS